MPQPSTLSRREFLGVAASLLAVQTVRAAEAPWVSIFHAACSVIRRAACICIAESAIQFCTVCFSASTDPRAWRCVPYSQSIANARCETPSQRMQ